jgi:peptidase M42 family hydrolase
MHAPSTPPAEDHLSAGRHRQYLLDQLMCLLQIPSPSGYTDRVVHYVCEQLEHLDIPFNVTRRGAIRATLKGRRTEEPDRAVCAHLDTLGAMVRHLKSNGRLALSPIGTWSSRFAEGARVTIFSRQGKYRGTILPLKASGHTYNTEVDTQPVSWDQIEIRVDAHTSDQCSLRKLGIETGDFIAVDPNPEMDDNGYINSRHLDDKAGVAILLSAAQAIRHGNISLPVDCHLLFTINEEIGVGATEVLYSDITEMVVIDSAMIAPGQNTSAFTTTLVMMDEAGPFDYHLNRKLARICRKHRIPYEKDVFRYYRSDSASAIEAGSDIRTALVGFGVDGSHGYERTHVSTLENTWGLILRYMQSSLTFKRDKESLGSLNGFPNQPTREPISIET